MKVYNVRINTLSVREDMAEQAVCSVSSKISGRNRHIPLVTVQDKSIFRSRLVNRIMYV